MFNVPLPFTWKICLKYFCLILFPTLHRLTLYGVQEIEMCENPKLANTARSQKKFFSDFRKFKFPRNIGFIWWYFENFRIFSENPKLANTARSQTNFRKSPTPGNLWSIWWYFENFRIFSENKKLANTVRCRTPHRLTLHGIDN